MILAQEIEDFLLKIVLPRYSSGEGILHSQRTDGSILTVVEEGYWRSCERCYAKDQYNSYVSIARAERVVWTMACCGSVTERVVDPGSIYQFLGRALNCSSGEAPYRGPRLYREELRGRRYRNYSAGAIEYFQGEEVISQGGIYVYFGMYRGGLVENCSVRWNTEEAVH